MSDLATQQTQASAWFKTLRDDIRNAFLQIEKDYAKAHGLTPAEFEVKSWQRPTEDKSDGGGGEMSIIHGHVFEKAGVNISTVHGEFSEKFRKEIHGAEEDPRFWASGISLVVHPCSPHVPAIHMNTRFVCTSKTWFGGGVDLTPSLPNDDDAAFFHNALKATCDAHNSEYYGKYKKWCDEYFFVKHRNCARGIGGIFYDYLEDDWGKNFLFTQDVGKCFLDVYPQLVRKHMDKDWNEEERAAQLKKRGLYAEFNLVYDRGTRFGLMTGGNSEAILMSLPPVATWP